MKLDNARYLQVFLFETIVWLVIWLWNDYAAFYLTAVLTAILVAVLVISAIAEAIERSRVPKAYFIVMALSIAASIMGALLYMVIFGGQMDWLKK